MGLRGYGDSQSIFYNFSAIFPVIFSVKEICATATEPAVKALIALVACISIANTVTRTDSYIRLAGTAIIRLIAVVIRTYKTPLLFANLPVPIKYSSVTMPDTVSAESIKAQMPHATLTHILGEPSH